MCMRLHVLEFECHLDLQADSSNNVCSKRMAQEFTLSFTIIISGVTIVYIGKN